jgi:hypothetical protein
MTETKTTATKTATITKLNLKANLKTDFSETLEITRTLFKDQISKTSIVESSLACACANAEAFTVTQLAKFIMTNLNVRDCFQKKDSNKNNDIARATELRIRRHVIHTIKTHHKADTLYSYDKPTDSVHFTDKYRALCTDDKVYRKRVAALLMKVKVQYKAPAKKKAPKKVAQKTFTQKENIFPAELKTA